MSVHTLAEQLSHAKPAMPDEVNESSLARVQQWVVDHDCAIISGRG